MITITDMVENGEREKATIEYKYDIEKICKEYTEDDLLFYESGNRMSGLGGIIILYKNEKYRILFIDEENELLYKTFPEVLNMEEKLFLEGYDKYKSEKYEWYFTGFGGKLYIDRRIFDEFKSEMFSFFIKIGTPIENDYPDEQVLHAYWITLAKKVLNHDNKIKIRLFDRHDFDDEFFTNYKIDDLLMFSFAEPGAMGIPGGVEAIVRNDNDVKVYSGSYTYNDNESIKTKIINFFKPIVYPSIDEKLWSCLNMGMGNILLVRKAYSKEFIDKYLNIIEETPFVLYRTWKYFADYVLNIYLNDYSDVSLLKSINQDIDSILNDFKEEKINKQKKKPKSKHKSNNSNDEKLYKYVKVYYADDYSEREYSYKTDIEEIEEGDTVLVDRNGSLADAIVTSVDYYKEDEVPYPLDKTKDIIEVTGHDEIYDSNDDYDYSNDPYLKNDDYNDLLLHSMFGRITISHLMNLISPKNGEEENKLFYYPKFNIFFYKTGNDKYKLTDYNTNIISDKMFRIIEKESILVPQKRFAITTDGESFERAIEFCRENNIPFHDDTDILEFTKEKNKLYEKEYKEYNESHPEKPFNSIDDIINYLKKDYKKANWKTPEPEYYIENGDIIHYLGGLNYDSRIYCVWDFLESNKYIDSQYYTTEFKESHPEYDNIDYDKLDYSKLGIDAISFIFLRIFNLERICEGIINEMAQNGTILKIVERLKELKKQKNE